MPPDFAFDTKKPVSMMLSTAASLVPWNLTSAHSTSRWNTGRIRVGGVTVGSWRVSSQVRTHALPHAWAGRVEHVGPGFCLTCLKLQRLDLLDADNLPGSGMCAHKRGVTMFIRI
jgi:hypothetical protein